MAQPTNLRKRPAPGSGPRTQQLAQGAQIQRQGSPQDFSSLSDAEFLQKFNPGPDGNPFPTWGNGGLGGIPQPSGPQMPMSPPATSTQLTRRQANQQLMPYAGADAGWSGFDGTVSEAPQRASTPLNDQYALMSRNTTTKQGRTSLPPFVQKLTRYAFIFYLGLSFNNAAVWL